MLDLIWDNSTDAIFALDQFGAVIDANPAFKSMLGWETEELKDKSYPPFIVDLTKEEHQTLLNQLKSGQNFPYKIMKRKNKDGEILDVLASYWAVNDRNILAIGMYKDFTEQMIIQRKLENSEYCYRTLVEYLPEAIIKQRRNKIEFINTAGCKLLGVEGFADIINHSMWDFVSSERKDEIQHIVDSAYNMDNKDGNRNTLVAKFVRKDGQEIWAEIKVIAIGSKDKPDIQIVFRDVTEKKRYEAQLEFLAYHDPLTGLKNRRVFSKIVQESVKTAKLNQKQIAILYLDIDHFKDINDTYGHDVGDQLLKEFTARMKSAVRDDDVLCRVGGDEFLILLKHANDKKTVEKIAERLLTVFRKTYNIHGIKLNVTSSIGIATFPNSGNSYNSLIRRADKALYRAKEHRNNYMFDDNR